MTKPVRMLRRGTAHYMAKLTEDQVREIRARREAGESCKELGAAFGIRGDGISRITRRLSWKHVS